MAGPNSKLTERMQIASGFVPVNLATAANTGDWFNMANYGRGAFILFKGAGSSSEDPVVVFSQATSAAGAGSKDLTINTTGAIDKKTGADLTAIAQWTAVTGGSASITTEGGEQAIWVFDIQARDLDINNGFTFVQASIADVGSTSQIGGMLFFGMDPVYPDKAVNMLGVLS